MGAIPCDNSITIEFDCQFRVDIRQGNVKVVARQEEERRGKRKKREVGEKWAREWRKEGESGK